MTVKRLPLECGIFYKYFHETPFKIISYRTHLNSNLPEVFDKHIRNFFTDIKGLSHA
jgi:hypothetical protein